MHKEKCVQSNTTNGAYDEMHPVDAPAVDHCCITGLQRQLELLQSALFAFTHLLVTDPVEPGTLPSPVKLITTAATALLSVCVSSPDTASLSNCQH